MARKDDLYKTGKGRHEVDGRHLESPLGKTPEQDIDDPQPDNQRGKKR
jgi:hypothetical protein